MMDYTYFFEKNQPEMAADPVIQYMSKEKIQKLLTKTRKSMEKAVKELDFLAAAQLRDELAQLKQIIESK